MNVSKPHACLLCNKSFGRKYDLRRHENTVHAKEESESQEDDNLEVDESSGSEMDESLDSEVLNSEEEVEDWSSDAESSSMELEDNAAYQELYQQAFEETQSIRDEKYQKYINQGMDEELAEEKAYMKTLWALQRTFFNNYMAYLWSNSHLKEDETHQEIMDDLEEKIDGGMNIHKALKRVIAKHRAKFDGLFQQEEDEDEEMESDDGDSV